MDKNNLCINEELVYIIGVIMGDGHISNSSKSKTDLSKDYRISIESVDFGFLKVVEKLIKKYVETKSIVRLLKKREGKQQSYYFQIRNKRFYLWLVEFVKIPPGAKSRKLRLPEYILKGTYELKTSFLAGLFDSDGGFRGKTIGFTMSSELFQDDIFNLLRELNISSSKDQWVNKITLKTYFGLRIHKSGAIKFLKEVILRNPEKIERLLVRECRSGQTGQINCLKKTI